MALGVTNGTVMLFSNKWYNFCIFFDMINSANQSKERIMKVSIARLVAFFLFFSTLSGCGYNTIQQNEEAVNRS